MVSAFAACQRLVLVKLAETSNEIVAIPALVELIAIEGAIVTIDPIWLSPRNRCDKEYRHVLALKGNQGQPSRGCRDFRSRAEADGFKDTKISSA